MAGPTPIQIKRTTVTGRFPNTTASYSTNSQYISTGEFAMNLTDRKLFSSDGTNYFEIGANLVNQSVTGILTANNGAFTTLTSNGVNVATIARTSVADAAYTVLSSDRLVAYTSITAARVVTLPAASAYPTGAHLTITDESGSSSGTNTITVTRAGTDTINGGTTTVINTAYGYVALESNGSNKWTLIDNVPTAGGGSTGANPTASVGTAVVNGTATTFMRSDAAPPIDQTMSPTWTGIHSFTGATITVATQAVGDNSTKAASTAFSLLANSIITNNVQTASYTLALSDAGKAVEMNVATANTVTIPANATVAFPVGTVIEILQYGAGQVTIAAATGVTLRNPSSLTTRAQYSTIAIRQRATNEWVVSGDVS